ncbi:MAG: HAD family phosphatase [Trueperaceae bacterium]|nr:MAG: HAD family phosphatase [Trueperaceae bacterium]
MIPLVVCDLDGTLVGSSGQVSECIWQTVGTLRAAGIRVALATGRPNQGLCHKVALQLGANHPHIFQSGALIAYPGGETTQVTALKESVTKTLVGRARELGLVLELYTPNALFIERKTPLGNAHAKLLGVKAIVRDLFEVAQNEPVIRAQWIVAPSQLEQIEDLAPREVQYSTATSPAVPEAKFVSVTKAGISKGSALKTLADTLKVDLQNLIVIGDSSGDEPMLELAGHPFVMANAEPHLHNRYKVVGDVDACGAVEALEQALVLQPR